MAKGRLFALVWCIINLLMCLSFLTPLVIITINFIMVPALVMFARLELKSFILFYTISLAAVGALAGFAGVVLMIMSLFFLPPAIVMGTFYKRKDPARSAITAGTVTLLGEFLLGLLISYSVGLRPMERVREFVLESLENIPEILRTSINEADIHLTITYFIQIIPMMLITAALFYTIIGHTVGRWLLRRNGMEIPGLPPVRTWKLPRSFAWYLLIVTFIDFLFINKEAIESNSTLAMIVLNLLPLLTMAFAVQAIAFLFFVSYTKKWSVALPILAIVLLVPIPPLIYIYCMLGVVDVLLPIRKRITK